MATKTERDEKDGKTVTASNAPQIEDEGGPKSPVPPRIAPRWDPHNLNGLMADRNLYLERDGRTVTDSLQGSGTLLAAKGGMIDRVTCERLGLELKGAKVEQMSKEAAEEAGLVVDPGTPNEGQIAAGQELIKVVRTGVLRPEPAPENPKLHIEEEIKAQDAEESDDDAEDAGADEATRAARKSARKAAARKPGKR